MNPKLTTFCRYSSKPKIVPQAKSLLLLIALFAQTGCAVVAVADAAVTVVATGVKVGAAVVETTVDVASAGIKAATGSDDDED